MEYKRKRLIRAALQKAEAKRKQTVRQAESAADTEQQTPEEYAQTVVSEKPHRRQKTCKARRWTQDESATVNFGFYRKSASVCQPHTPPSPLKQKVPPLRRVPTGENHSSVSAFGKRRWISGRSKRPIPTVTKCRR